MHLQRRQNGSALLQQPQLQQQYGRQNFSYNIEPGNSYESREFQNSTTQNVNQVTNSQA